MLKKRYIAALFSTLLSLTSLGVTLAYWKHAEEVSATKQKRDFADVADQISNGVRQRLEGYELVLLGIKGFYEASDLVNRAELQKYLAALRVERTQPGLLGIGIVAYVRHEGKARYIIDMQGRGYPDYRIKPDGDRPDYAPVAMLEPQSEANVRALGFDLQTTAPTKDAIERARDSGMVAVTPKTKLVQDAGKAPAPAVVMYVPMYAKGADTTSLAGRRAGLVGWANAPFRVRDLMSGLISQIDAGVSVDIFDGEVPLDDNSLFSYNPAAVASILDSSLVPLSTQRQIDVGGRRWTLVMHHVSAFENFDDKSQLWLIGLAGTVASLLLGLMTWVLATGRQRALTLAQEMTQELRNVRDNLESTLSAMPDLLFELGLDGRYHDYKTTRTNALAAPPAFFLGRLLTEVLAPDAAATCMQALEEAHATGISTGRQIALTIGGEQTWFELSVARKLGGTASDPRFIMISRDITARKQSELALQATNAHLKLLEAKQRLSAQVFDSSRDGIVITDRDNRIVSVNPAFLKSTGYDVDSVLGRNPSMLSSGRHNKAFFDGMWQSILAHGYWHGEVWNRRKDGDIYPEWLSISTVKDPSGETVHYIGILSDLTAHKAAQEKIEYLAHFDALTTLPNRTLLQDRGRLALASAERSHTHVALLCINMDRFKNVNDSLGIPVGDRILQALASRLVNHLHVDDTVCRQGGDEFVVLLPGTGSKGAAHVADKLLKLIAESVDIDAEQFNLTASIGVAVFPDNGNDFEKLSQCADSALHRAKQHGGNNYQFYTNQMQLEAHEALLVESHLRQALKRGEFLLYYQPQVDAATSHIVGIEALIRWQHPQWGMVSPARFIPIAEQSGQIIEIGEWVLRTAAQQVMDWRAAGLAVVPVAVNLSAMQFRRSTLCDSVSAVLRDSRLPPALLELELTESVAMEDSSFTIDQISSLHALGVSLSIDDFGTGYSSLGYLKRYKIDKLKIDQSFVRDIDRDVGEGTIVKTIIELARGLGFKTIAEGVETQTQLDFLRTHGCDEIQGYFFSRPVPPSALATLLAQGGPLAGGGA